ncbi:MAG: hypothetical protein FWC38_01225 [Proteobacteria bacterium]|nr:hypothetical protein [Pseudomonadota bacterium]MCL2306864.1 hypothetical protein [Pseudomonadota bacterium]
MKRFFLPALTGALALTLSVPVLAEDVTYPPGALQNITCVAAWNNVLTPDGSGNFKSNAVSGGNATTPTNTVTLNSGAATNPNHVSGAINCLDDESVNFNRVSITGSEAFNVFGAYHLLNSNDAASVNNNQVTVSGGTVSNVYGGMAHNNGAGNATANGNTVTITGGTINGTVLGGLADSNSGAAEASNNTVVIVANLPASTFGVTASLFGGDARGVTAVSTGNTLQMASAGLTVYELDSFQNFRFTLPASLSGGGTVLTTTDYARISTNSTVSVTAASGLTVSTGDVFTLIGCGAGCDFSGTLAAASQNGTLNGYRYTLSVTGDGSLIMTIGAPLAAQTATSVPVMHPAMLVLLALALGGLAARRRV